MASPSGQIQMTKIQNPKYDLEERLVWVLGFRN